MTRRLEVIQRAEISVTEQVLDLPVNSVVLSVTARQEGDDVYDVLLRTGQTGWKRCRADERPDQFMREDDVRHWVAAQFARNRTLHVVEIDS